MDLKDRIKQNEVVQNQETEARSDIATGPVTSANMEGNTTNVASIETIPPQTDSLSGTSSTQESSHGQGSIDSGEGAAAATTATDEGFIVKEDGSKIKIQTDEELLAEQEALHGKGIGDNLSQEELDAAGIDYQPDPFSATPTDTMTIQDALAAIGEELPSYTPPEGSYKAKDVPNVYLKDGWKIQPNAFGYYVITAYPAQYQAEIKEQLEYFNTNGYVEKVEGFNEEELI